MSELRGTARMDAANAVPLAQAGLDPAMQSLANGRIVASLFTESDIAGSDTKFAVGKPLRASSGRKLAGISGVESAKLPISFPPPHWSRRYDYAIQC